MTIEELLKELKKDQQVYNLALLYLSIKNEEKEFLLKLYNNPYNDDVVEVIENAIYKDKETFAIIKQIIDNKENK